MKFYEISGQSCTGKTSFIKEHVKSDKNYILYERNTINLFFDFICGLKYLGIKRIKTIFLWSLKEDASLLFRLNIFRNSVTKFGIFLKLTNNKKSRKQTYLVDEGVSHIPFIFLNTSTDEVINFIAFELSSLNIKFLTCDQRNDIESRLSKRGHKRLMFLDKTDFVNRNFSIQSILIKIYPGLCKSFVRLENVRNTE